MRPLCNTDRPRPITGLLALASALALAGADTPGGVPSDPAFAALKVDGTTVSGRLRALDIKGGVVLAVDEKDATTAVPATALVKLTREGNTAPTSAEGGIVVFPDGDRLLLAVIGPAGEAAIEVQTYALGTAAIPLDAILGLVLVPPVEADALQTLVGRVRDEPRTGEVLWLSNGDRLVGGLLGIDDKKIAFQPAGGKVELDRSSVIALGFDPKLVSYPKPDGPYFELTLVDGSRLGVTAAHVEAGHVQAMTRYSQPVRVPLGELAQVHIVNGHVAYLGDRKPTLDKYVSYLGPTRPARPNLAVDGQPLRLGGKAYDRGIGTQSRSYLVYGLEPGLKRFQALVGLDDRAGPLGSVVFRVVVNGEEKFVTPPMTARETPRAVDLDIRGAKTLVLITDFGDRGEVRDHADWVEARLVR